MSTRFTATRIEKSWLPAYRKLLIITTGLSSISLTEHLKYIRCETKTLSEERICIPTLQISNEVQPVDNQQWHSYIKENTTIVETAPRKSMDPDSGLVSKSLVISTLNPVMPDLKD